MSRRGRPPLEERSYYTVAEAAELLGWAPCTLRYRLDKGQVSFGYSLPSISGKSHTYYIGKDALDEYRRGFANR